ncbi:hypothetical protein PoB_005687600 [Plakobranchus ocellatus]|uniref:Uncharacterized protein n=1 Tax=Plakobranchus ocellatus TaxID=259542 RepID=A0AAV4C4Y0_9GAST|nr:hypothetical protein PoB_005687600 [Plakobranchus ocellatus]
MSGCSKDPILEEKAKFDKVISDFQALRQARVPWRSLNSRQKALFRSQGGFAFHYATDASALPPFSPCKVNSYINNKYYGIPPQGMRSDGGTVHSEIALRSAGTFCPEFEPAACALA